MLPLVEPELLLRVSMLPSLCSSAGGRERGREGERGRGERRGERPQIRCLHNDKAGESAVGSESFLRSVGAKTLKSS